MDWASCGCLVLSMGGIVKFLPLITAKCTGIAGTVNHWDTNRNKDEILNRTAYGLE